MLKVLRSLYPANFQKKTDEEMLDEVRRNETSERAAGLAQNRVTIR